MVDLTPAACHEIRRALDYALAKLRIWGIEPPPGSWIQEAATWLDTVVARNSLGSNEDELRRTSAASALAVDLYHISACLGKEPNGQLAAELAGLARGALLGRGDLAAGKDYLAQFWVGALLAQAQLRPHIIAYDIHDRSKPDYVIQKGGLGFVVEVKHPRSRSSAPRAVLTAASQIRKSTGPGIIILDVTECMSVDPWAVTRAAGAVREQIGSELQDIHQELTTMASTYKRSGKFSEVAMLVTFARFWNLAVDGSGTAERDAGLHLRAYGFPYLWSRQVTLLTREIQAALREGVKQLTGNDPKWSYS